jgi:hypothetical protein
MKHFQKTVAAKLTGLEKNSPFKYRGKLGEKMRKET